MRVRFEPRSGQVCRACQWGKVLYLPHDSVTLYISAAVMASLVPGYQDIYVLDGWAKPGTGLACNAWKSGQNIMMVELRQACNACEYKVPIADPRTGQACSAGESGLSRDPDKHVVHSSQARCYIFPMIQWPYISPQLLWIISEPPHATETYIGQEHIAPTLVMNLALNWWLALIKWIFDL